MVKKLLRILLYLYLVFIVSVLSAWSVWHAMLGGPKLSPQTRDLIIDFAAFPSQVFHVLSLGSIIDDKRKIPNTTDEAVMTKTPDSISVNTYFLASSISGDDSSEFKLINSVDFSIKKRWVVSEDNILENIDKKHHDIPVQLGHPFLLKDSSLIFSSGGLFRINKDNSFKWINNTSDFHHSIEAEGDSVVWVGSKIIGNNYFNYGLDTLMNDAICKVDIETGKIKFFKSVADILAQNGYKPLLQIGKHEADLIHLNDIQPVNSDTKYWKNGDLFISVRNRNTIFLYRPSTNKILWLKTGPWLAQHDVDIVDQKTIMVFGNDVFRGRKQQLVNGYNDIYFYDFEKDSIYTPYREIMKKLFISTITEGRCDLLPNGDLFIDESNNGKLYVIDKDRMKLKYVERTDSKHIKMFKWVRPIFN